MSTVQRMLEAVSKDLTISSDDTQEQRIIDAIRAIAVRKGHVFHGKMRKADVDELKEYDKQLQSRHNARNHLTDSDSSTQHASHIVDVSLKWFCPYLL